MSPRYGAFAALLLAVLACLGPLPSTAAATPVDDDVVAAQATLPAGHPCKPSGTIDVQVVPGLRGDDGRLADGAAPQGVLLGGAWLETLASGEWIPLACFIRLDAGAVATRPACWVRRVVFHEIGHLGGRTHKDGGVMSEWAETRDQTPIAGCHAILPPLRDRVVARVLELAPRGWAVTCEPLRARVAYCSAESPSGRRVRWYRARVAHPGSAIPVRRIHRRPRP